MTSNVLVFVHGVARRITYLGAAAAIAVLATCASVAAGSPIVGANVANPQWLGASDQEKVLRELSDAKVRYIRVPLTPAAGSIEPTLDFVRRANGEGIGTVLMVWPAFDPRIPPRPAKSGTAATWAQPDLSASDAEAFRRAFAPILAEIEGEGVKLAAFEFANEFNWTPFNGDFAVPGNNKIYRLGDLLRDPGAQRIRKGLDRLIPSLRVLRQLRDTSQVNASTPILLGGMADTGQLPAVPPHPDTVAPEAAIAYLRDQGLDRVVDGYGVHAYFDANQSEGKVRTHLAALLRFCAPEAGAQGKPCWLTEWGVALDNKACPASDDRRARFTRMLLDALRRYTSARRLRALLYFAWWDENFGLYRCGTLTATGREALARIAPPR